MIIPILISLTIVAATIFIHGVGTAWWLTFLFRQHVSYGFYVSLKILSKTAIFLMVLHYLEIALWAAVYMVVPVHDKISQWEEAIYFSTVTYTTLGYGDITLPPVWRIMSGFEGMNGILMFGWSTTMLYVVVQKIASRKNTNKIGETQG